MSENRSAPLFLMEEGPPDRAERRRALDPERSFLVQAPAGSGKTYLLTQRFLRLLSRAETPDEIVAITFTNAAAAEMRQRILGELEKAEDRQRNGFDSAGDTESMESLAAAALARSEKLGWQLLDQPAQLRIATIDGFCRGLALQCPLGWGLLSGLGGRLDPVEDPSDLYRRAARQVLEKIGVEDSATRLSIEALLLWRDNNWKDVEDLLVKMLDQRNRWYQDFVFAREPDAEAWQELRRRLESPFRRGAERNLYGLSSLLDRCAGSRESALKLARFACQSPGNSSPWSLAERAELPTAPFGEGLAEAAEAYGDLARFLMTKEGNWRQKGGLRSDQGFPSGPSGKAAKERFAALVEDLNREPGLKEALAGFLNPTPTGYSDEEWKLVGHCFSVLRSAAAELQVVFAETGSVDFTEVARIALETLSAEDGHPSEFALKQAGGIRHLLVDEFQDTSRNQHQLLSRLISAWPEREGRTCFCVGDPMQSIYAFRDAEVELFERLKTHGLDTLAPDGSSEPFRFEFLALRANFRTQPALLEDLNSKFERVFAEDDGSGVRFSLAAAARERQSFARTELHPVTELHLDFMQATRKTSADPEAAGDADTARQSQLNRIVALIRRKNEEAKRKRDASGEQQGKYRIAVLGRTRTSLIPIAESLQEEGIPFRAIDLVPLRQRPEVLDALALARAALNPADRVAWLSVLRAPWCGLSLAELYAMTSGDDHDILATPVPELLETRLPMLFDRGEIDGRAYAAAHRVAGTLSSAGAGRPAATESLGTWLEAIWKALGGEDTVDQTARENLRLLWSCLDGLPGGEVDLFGPGLDSALERLFSVPDPAVSSDFGVQLMTIHKSKGLEFEVVLVPDLDARTRPSEKTMISWLERGLAAPDKWGNVTEFLIAPIQPKGEDASFAKKWVDGVRRTRETQELRRVLYVAATRAREELHLFAKPRFSLNKDGSMELAKPSPSLLATAWPAIEVEIEFEFQRWVRTNAAESTQPEMLEQLAAGMAPAENPPARRTTTVRRLPAGYQPPRPIRSLAQTAANAPAEMELYARHEGGLAARLEGVATHELLERLSWLRTELESGPAVAALAGSLPSVEAILRGQGLAARDAASIARRSLAIVERAAKDPACAWILSPHPESMSERAWTSVFHGKLWNLRPDRVIFAPPPAEFEAASTVPVWWVIDYKTSYADDDDLANAQAFLAEHRQRHAGQLEAYVRVLRSFLGSPDASTPPIRAGIYYPRLRLFDSWQV